MDEDTRLNDARATARDLDNKGAAFSFRILRGIGGRYKVITDPYSLRLGVYDTEDEARAEIKRLSEEGLTWEK